MIPIQVKFAWHLPNKSLFVIVETKKHWIKISEDSGNVENWSPWKTDTSTDLFDIQFKVFLNLKGELLKFADDP